jgi:hypothetical protein
LFLNTLCRLCRILSDFLTSCPFGRSRQDATPVVAIIIATRYVVRIGILRSSALHRRGALKPAIEEANANVDTPVPDGVSCISTAIVIPIEYNVVKAIAYNTWLAMIWKGEVERYSTRKDAGTQTAPKENMGLLPNLSDNRPTGTLERKRTMKQEETIIPI